MHSDFIGLQVIWPPDGTKPPRHEHDIVFVHDIHSGSVSDWQDENGVCWPAEHLSLDLGNARILSFGYDPTNLNVRSDGFFEGRLVFNQGQNLWIALKSLSRSSNEKQVPLTFVGHGTGGIVVKSALCISHLKEEALDLTLRKTKHVLLLDTPQKDLTWEAWETFSNGYPGAESIGQWKVWSTALQNLRPVFNEIAYRFNITTANSENDSHSQFLSSTFTGQSHERSISCHGIDHQSISRLSGGSISYNNLLKCIRESMQRMIYITDGSRDFDHIRSWLGRGFDQMNIDSCNKNLEKHHAGTGRWLFDHVQLRDWGNFKAENPILWLTGPDSCGKSVLSSVAAERLRQNDQQPAVVSIMLAFDHPRSEYHLLTQLALQLLNHLVATRGCVNAEVLSLLTKKEEASKKLSRVHELIRVLVSQCNFVYILVDGLDEAILVGESAQNRKDSGNIEGPWKHLKSMLSFAVELAQGSEETPVRLWCSSRYTETIAEWMQEIRAFELTADRTAIEADVASYLDHHSKQVKCKIGSEPCRQTLIADIRKIVKSDFLFAAMITKRMGDYDISSDGAVALLLRGISSSKADFLQDQWDRIHSSTRPAAQMNHREQLGAIRSIISIVSFAKRPLRMTELREALEICKISCQDLDLDDEDEIERRCAPFIDVYERGGEGQIFQTFTDRKKLKYLRLAHASIFEFLHKISKDPISEVDQVRPNPNLIAHACLQYLSQERYSDPGMEVPQNHHFLGYAAKYWHKDVDESKPDSLLLQAASSFLGSSQFLTMTRFQSLLLHRHFSRSLDNIDNPGPPTSFINIPKILETEESTRLAVEDYRSFVGEWSCFLHLGTTDFEFRGHIDECFWGALGKHNAFQTRGSKIEKNASFLLEDDCACEEKVAGETESSYRVFCQSISDDGNRVAVWKLPTRNITQEGSPDVGNVKICRECWYIGGQGPPCPYDRQEFLIVNPKRTQLNSYQSHSDREFAIIPAMDFLPQVPALAECGHGNAVRIGNSLFSRPKEGEWVADGSNDGNGTTQWDSIQIQGSWIVRSCRKYVDAAVRNQNEPINHEEKPTQDSSMPSNPGESTHVENLDPQVESDGDEKENAEVDISEPADTAQEVQSENESGSFSAGSSSDSEVMISSAEEYFVASSSDINSLSEGPWFSSEEDDSSGNEGTDDDNESVASSSSASSCASNMSAKRRSKRTRVLQTASKSISHMEDSDADDESSESEHEDEPESDDNARPIRLFTGYHTCDICGMDVARREYMKLASKPETFHQCGLCRLAEDGSGNCYDICSRCFDNGYWCKDPNHLLSKAIVSLRNRKIDWQDRISQHTAPPLIKIIAEKRQKVSGLEDDTATTHCFRYMQRHASMLHESQPVIHPGLPLLVYPLDGSQLLFGNLQENTYFTYDVPFQAIETAETSGSKCIPISISLRFSTCGKFLHLIRLTARNTITANLQGTFRLCALSMTVALSSRDVCSGRPHLLPFRQGFDLGSCPGFMQELPFAITWTDSHAYVSMSLDTLRVLRFQRCTDTSAMPDEDITKKVHIFSRHISLPWSARSRAVKFFPSNDGAPIRLVLGSLRGTRPQPPVVVYLKVETAEQWFTSEERRNIDAFRTSFHLRNDPLIEEPHIDDDDGLLVMIPKASEPVTIEPIIPFRRWLQNGFQTRGMYCPSCFELSLTLNYLRPPPYLPIYYHNGIASDDLKYKIEWRVRAPILIEALRAGCQFCCYVAVRLFGFNHTIHTSQFIGNDGTRCCAKGSKAQGPEEIEKAIRNINKLEWQVEPDKQMIVFDCQPHNQDTKTRKFDKLFISLPGLTTGKKGSTQFAPTMVTVYGTNDAGESQSITSFFHHGEMSHGTPECVLELHALPDDAAHDLIETKPLTTFRGGDENLKVVKSWLHECQSNHAFCKRNENTQVPLPSRLLEIVDDTYVNLVETAGQVGKYVALSYCWGPTPENNSMTTTANLEERLQPHSLLRSELPAAIGDALSIAEDLDIKYVWVDALCMIQDSPDDKHRELGLMSMYYRNSFFTIAVSTPRCTMGFVGVSGRCDNHPHFELPRDLVPLKVFAMARNKDWGKSGTVYVREENPYQLSEEPINKRAWTLQEYILAPRILMFGSRVMWFCQHMTHSDGGVEDWSFDEHEIERTRREFQIALSKLDRDTSAEQQSSSATNRNNGDDIYHLWHRLVGTYSRRSLTNEADKLPAISAVAAEFAKLSRDEYLAGLWRSNLLRDLLWRTADPTMHKSKDWRAPSWSWASVTDPILYDHPPPQHATQLAQVVSVEAVPLTPMAPLGEIKGASLVIRAPSISFKFPHEHDSEISKMLLKDFGVKSQKSERGFLLEALKMHSRPTMSNRKEDDKKEYEFPEETFMVFLYGERDELMKRYNADTDTEIKKQKWIMWGLVLKRVPSNSEHHVFERILTFSQISINFEGFDMFLSEQETFHLI